MGLVILALVMHASYKYPTACMTHFNARLLLIDFQMQLLAAVSD